MAHNGALVGAHLHQHVPGTQRVVTPPLPHPLPDSETYV